MLIVAVLLWARRPRASAGSPVGEHLRTELTHIDRQIFIAQHVAWWYVAPIYIGINLFIAGAKGPRSMFAVTYAIVTLAFSLFIVWLNRQGAGKLRALRDSLLREVETVRESQTDR